MSTITTLGNSEMTPESSYNYLTTTFLLLLGIITYGLVIKQMRHLIQMTQTYQNTKNEKVDDLEAWLISRESKSNFQHISKM